MKDINAHTHWQFGNFSPNKESRFIYVDKPTKAPEVEKEVKEAMEQTKNLEQVQQQAGEKVKQAEGDVKKLGDKLKMLKDLHGRVNNAVATDSTEKVVFRSQEVLLKDIDATHLQEDVDKTKADITTAQEALKEEQEKSKEAVEKATEALDQALSKLSPKQQEAFKKLKAANEKAKNTPPGSAEGKNIIEAILALILEWIQSAGDKDKDKDKDKGAQSPGNTPPQGPENNNQTPPEKQEAPELKAVRKEIEDSDYRTVYDNARDAMNRAKAKLDVGPPRGLRKNVALDGATKVDREKAVSDAQEALDNNSTPAQESLLRENVEKAKENLRSIEATIAKTQKEIEHYENEYQVNKDKVDLMDGAREVAEKEAEEITKGLQRVAAEIGTVDNPNEQALDDAIDSVTVGYKADTLDDVQFTSNYTESEWDKVKAVAKDMGLDATAFEIDNDGVIQKPDRFASELLAASQRLDAGAETDVAVVKEMTDAGIGEALAKEAYKTQQEYGIKFKAERGNIEVSDDSNIKDVVYAYARGPQAMHGELCDAIENYLKHNALDDISSKPKATEALNEFHKHFGGEWGNESVAQQIVDLSKDIPELRRINLDRVTGRYFLPKNSVKADVQAHEKWDDLSGALQTYWA